MTSTTTGSPAGSSRAFLCAVAASALSTFAACGSSDESSGPSSTTITITAPAIVSPQPGSTIEEAQPTLTVANVTVSNGATPTYTFQVATDAAFASIVAQASGIAQGAGGQTSWQVTVTLEPGQYFWRARASASGVDGPFSSAADFTLEGVALAEGVVLFDPLTDGTTKAVARSGGEFTPDGWKVTSNADFLRYEVDAISSGFVQWENKGLLPRGITDDSHMLMGMWDPTAGGFRQNPFRVNVQKLWPNPHNPPFLRLRWISNGEQHDAGNNFRDWDPGVVYTWRLEWGPESGANTAKLFLDGNEIMQIRYGRTYLPNTHWIELGIAERGESVIDAVYRNVQIGRK